MVFDPGLTFDAAVAHPDGDSLRPVSVVVTRAGQGRGLQRAYDLGHPANVPGVSFRILSVATVEEVAGVELMFAQGLSPGGAVLAGVAEPGYRHPFALPHLRDALADSLHDAYAFVAGDERQLGFHGPVTVSGVDVGVAQARSLYPDDDLTVTRLGLGNLLDVQGFRKIVSDGCPTCPARYISNSFGVQKYQRYGERARSG